jgi:hypothetical protein
MQSALILILGIAGAISAVLNFYLVFSPMGRPSIASPATSAWAGVILAYQAAVTYRALSAQKSQYTKINMEKRGSGSKLLLVQGLMVILAIACCLMHPIPD